MAVFAPLSATLLGSKSLSRHRKMQVASSMVMSRLMLNVHMV